MVTHYNPHGPLAVGLRLFLVGDMLKTKVEPRRQPGWIKIGQNNLPDKKCKIGAIPSEKTAAECVSGTLRISKKGGLSWNFAHLAQRSRFQIFNAADEKTRAFPFNGTSRDGEAPF